MSSRTILFTLLLAAMVMSAATAFAQFSQKRVVVEAEGETKDETKEITIANLGDKLVIATPQDLIDVEH